MMCSHLAKVRRSVGKQLCAALLLLAAGTLLVSPSTRTSHAQQEPARQLMQTGAADATKRIALVIGNSAYATAPTLKNPSNDARDMAAALKALGFEVSSGVNIGQREMKRLIREFGQRLKGGGHGLFYFAGHGVQARGHNYMIPVDADIQSEADVEDSGVDVNLVLSYMDDAQNHLNIVILDACRNNPFARSFRSASDGLAQVDAPTGTLIAYATAPGRVAADGVGDNGLYTSELLKAMRIPDLTATEMFMQVRREVMARTGNKQVPWEASSLTGSFYFTPRGASSPPVAEVSRPLTVEPAAPRTADAATFELSYWETIKSSSEPQDFISYLEKYPKGQFVDLARRRAGAPTLAAAAAAHNQKGLDFYNKKDFAAAETEFRTAILFSPQSVHHYNLANTLKAARKPGEAEERRESVRLKEVELKQAVQAAPTDQSAHHSLAAFYKEQGRLAEAETAYREAIRVATYDTYMSVSDLLDIYRTQGRYAESEALLRDVVRANSGAARGAYSARTAHEMLARFLADQNRMTEAEATYRTALTFEPDNLSIVGELARVLVKQNKTKESDNEWKAYVKKKPEYGHYSFALHLGEQKRWADAEVQHREALKLSPDDIDRLTYLIKTLEEQKKNSDAEAELKRAAARKPTSSVYSMLGKFYVKQKRWLDAEAAFRESLRLEPTSYAAPLDELVNVLKEQKKYSEAEAELRAAARRNPTAANHQRLGRFFESVDRWSDAEAAYREVMRLEPSASNQNVVVQTLIAQQKFEEAETEWKAFVKSKPEWESYWFLGNFLQDRREFSEAEIAYREATKLAPTNAQNFSYLGSNLIAQKKFEQAETALRSAVRFNPTAGYYVLQLARVLVKHNKVADAEAEMKALLPRKSIADNHHVFALFLTEQKRFADAEAQMREAIRLHPYYYYYSKLGESLENQNKLLDAEAAFKEAIRLEPNAPTPYFEFAKYLKRREKWAEAESQYREALRITTSDQSQRLELALVLAKQNKTVEAEAEYKLAEAYFGKLLIRYPLNSYYRHRLGMALEGQNKLADAEKEYAEAERLDPEIPEYNESLQRLRAKTKSP